MCLRRLRKPLVPQLKRQAAASPGKHQLLPEIPATLARARTSIRIIGIFASDLLHFMFSQNPIQFVSFHDRC